MDNFDGTMFYHAILARIQDEIKYVAKDLYFKTRMHLSISMDDLVQEGMIGAWQACTRYDESKIKNESSVTGYCMQRAKGAMQDYIKWHRRRYESERSLEAHLEVKTEKGTICQDVADKLATHAQTSPLTRESIQHALNDLTAKERAAIMAAFQLEDGETREVFSSMGSYSNARTRGIKKLRTLLKPEDLILA